MSGKRRRTDQLSDSDSDSNLADSPDRAMDSDLPAADPGLSVTSDPGSNHGSSLTTARYSRPDMTAASATDPNPSMAGPSDSSSELYLPSSGSYLIIKPKDENVSFRKVNIFWPSKYLGMICGNGTLHMESPANGTLIVKTETRAQTKALLKCTRFCEKDVTISLHQARNTTKGTIFAPEMRYMSEDEILEGLRPEGVSHVRRLTTFRDGQRRDTSLLAITFNTTKLPDTLLAGHIRYEVRVFIPNPLRCFQCQRFGHSSKFCKQDARCHKCGAAPHEGSPCSAPMKCLNCNATDHATNSTQCPTWKEEKSICEIKAKTGISYPEARRRVKAEQATPVPGKSYAKAASVQTTSISTQTEPLPALPPLQVLKPLLTTTAATMTTNQESMDAMTEELGTVPDSQPDFASVASSQRIGPPCPPPTSRSGDWQTARGRVKVKPAGTGQPVSSEPRPPSNTRGRPTQQLPPAVCVALGRSRSQSTGRYPPVGGSVRR